MSLPEAFSAPVFAAVLITAGILLLHSAFTTPPRRTSKADAPAAETGSAPAAPAPRTPVPARVISQTGFAEVNGRVVPFQAVVRQESALSARQVAAFKSHLSSPRGRKRR